jgi:MFS family permease
MRRVFLFAAAFALVAAVVTSLTPLPIAVRTLFGVPLVLGLPGWALLAATGLNARLSRALSVASAIGTSVAVTVLLGLVLDLTPGGLVTVPWAASLAAVSIIGFIVAAVRGPANAALPKLSDLFPSTHAARLAVSLAVALVAVTVIGAHRGDVEYQRDQSFVQVWVTPSPRMTRTVDVGLRSLVQDSASYRIVLTGDDGSELRVWSHVALNYGRTWTESVTLPAGIYSARLVAYYRPGMRPVGSVLIRGADIRAD